MTTVSKTFVFIFSEISITEAQDAEP